MPSVRNKCAENMIDSRLTSSLDQVQTQWQNRDFAVLSLPLWVGTTYIHTIMFKFTHESSLVQVKMALYLGVFELISQTHMWIFLGTHGTGSFKYLA